MKKIRAILFVLLGFVLLLAGTLTETASAQPSADVAPCVPGVFGPYTTQVTGRPDSGVGGGTWAHDTFKRTTKVTDNCDGTFTLMLTDAGHFLTVAGVSPQAGVPLSGGVSGTFSGGATMVVTSSTPPGAPPAASAGNTSSSEWAGLMFGEYSSVMGNWGWTYKRLCEKWVNAAGGNSGDITGKSCHKPTVTVPPNTSTTTTTGSSTSTTTTTGSTAPTTTTVSPPAGGEGVHYANCDAVEAAGKAPLAAGAPGYRAGLDSDSDNVACEGVVAGAQLASKPTDLAYTGATGIGWLIGLGSLLLLAGGSAVVLVRRRRRSI